MDKYNGWANYATWRINLELWDDDSWQDGLVFNDIHELAEYLKETSEDIITQGEHIEEVSSFVFDYALAFMQEVDWHEIAKRKIEDNPKLIKTN